MLLPQGSCRPTIPQSPGIPDMCRERLFQWVILLGTVILIPDSVSHFSIFSYVFPLWPQESHSIVDKAPDTPSLSPEKPGFFPRLLPLQPWACGSCRVRFFLSCAIISMVLVRSPLRPRHHSHYVTLSSPVVIYWPPSLALYLWKLLATDPECSFSFQILPTSWPVWYVCEIFLTSQFLESISDYLFHSASISQPHGHSQTLSSGNHSTGNTLAIQWLGPELARLWLKFDPWLGN